MRIESQILDLSNYRILTLHRRAETSASVASRVVPLRKARLIRRTSAI
jgi:hypothetical protein